MDARTITDLLDAAKTRIGLAVRVFSAPSDPVDGEKDVTVAGTSEPLAASSTPMRSVLVVAKTTNTGAIYIGTSSVSSTRYIASLSAGQTTELAFTDLANVYIDAATSGDGAWLYIFK